LTVPLPEPLELVVIHEALLEADHEHPDEVDTLNDAEPPPAAGLADVGLSE